MLKSYEIKALFASMNALQSAWKEIYMDTDVMFIVFNDMVQTLMRRGINHKNAMFIARHWDKIDTHCFLLNTGTIVSGVDLIQNSIANANSDYSNSKLIEKEVVVNTIEKYLLHN